MIDEEYIVVGSHIDELTKRKIANGEYIDFTKLIPKDKVTMEDDNRMEIINKGGLTYWLPVNDRESSAITNFNRWEQAFRVFSNIFTAFHPGKAGELFQYNHIIHTAAQTFAWKNVYRYDKEFRIHMAKHHPYRSVILQQAWSMCLKDKVSGNSNGYSRGGGSGNGNNNVR